MSEECAIGWALVSFVQALNFQKIYSNRSKRWCCSGYRISRRIGAWSNREARLSTVGCPVSAVVCPFSVRMNMNHWNLHSKTPMKVNPFRIRPTHEALKSTSVFVSFWNDLWFFASHASRSSRIDVTSRLPSVDIAKHRKYSHRERCPKFLGQANMSIIRKVAPVRLNVVIRSTICAISCCETVHRGSHSIQ